MYNSFVVWPLTCTFTDLHCERFFMKQIKNTSTDKFGSFWNLICACEICKGYLNKTAVLVFD